MKNLVRVWFIWVAVLLGGLAVPLAAHAGSPAVTAAMAFGSSSVELNASTSLTFTFTNALGATPATNGAFTDTLPAGLVVATPNGLSGSCLNAPQNGNVTATAGSGTISLSGMYLGGNSNCNLTVNVTGTTLGSKVNAVSYSYTGMGAAATANATVTVVAAAPVVTQPIPNHDPAPGTSGIGSLPTTVDLSKGQGPSMTTCLLNAVKGMEGFSQAVYLGQDAYGVASIDLKDGRYLSFYPLTASTDTSRAPGLYLTSGNRSIIATSCGTFEAAPAVYNLAKLGALLAGLQSTDVRLNTNADGVATYVLSGTTYVVRPDLYVARGAASTAGLSLVADGFSFNDGAGSTQLLRGAFVDADALRVAMISAGHLGDLVGQVDGTFVYTNINGRWSLRAEAQLSSANVAPSVGNALFYADSERSFWYRGSPLLMWQRMTYFLLSK